MFLSFGDIFTFPNSCAIQTNLGTKKLLEKTVLENMGYWQNGLEIENTEAKRCFATHDEDNDYFNMRIYIILFACVYIFNSSTLFNNVLMAQWLTLMPRNREAAGSNLSGVLAFL